ncbi:MAG TPA: hypothetical protein VGN16_00095 [Acidobacteriaceae bacterium]|jgi:uncharacterized membrane protein
MNKKVMFRIVIELLIAAYLLVVGIRQFFLPQFGWPTWMFYGPAIVGILIALMLVADAIRNGRRYLGLQSNSN